MNKESIDIIIISYNTCDLTLSCIDSVKKNNLDNNIVSITVVDNASTDDTVDTINLYHPDVNVIRNSKNLGYGAAINVGMENTSSKIVIVSNTDVEFHADSISRLVEFILVNKEIGAAGPQQIYPNGDWQRSYGTVPGLREGLMDFLGLTSLCNLFRNIIWNLFHCNGSEKSVGYIDGAVIAFRRSAFDAIGGFDKKYFFFAEESDFCYRLKNAGWKIMFFPKAYVTHIRGGSLDNKKVVNERKLKLLIDGKILLVKKHYTIRQLHLYIALEKFHAIKMYLIYSVIGYFSKNNHKKEKYNVNALIFKKMKILLAEEQRLISANK